MVVTLKKRASCTKITFKKLACTLGLASKILLLLLSLLLLLLLLLSSSLLLLILLLSLFVIITVKKCITIKNIIVLIGKRVND